MIYAIDVAEKRESRRHLKNVYNFTVGLSLHIFLKKDLLLQAVKFNQTEKVLFF